MKNRNNVTLRLILDVTYDLNGTSVEYLKTELERAPSLLVANGLLSGDSPAQVNDFNTTISENTMSNQPHNDKRSPSTDALETLGMVHYKPEKRDAIHLAVEPVTASMVLSPGQKIGIINGCAYITGMELGVTRAIKVPYHGIVDPFLPCAVSAGEKFWFVMAPRMVQSLRHVWEHPDFPPGT